MTTHLPLIPLLVVFQTTLAREVPERTTPWFQHNGGGKLCYAYNPDKGDAMPKGVYCWRKRNHSPREAPMRKISFARMHTGRALFWVDNPDGIGSTILEHKAGNNYPGTLYKAVRISIPTVEQVLLDIRGLQAELLALSYPDSAGDYPTFAGLLLKDTDDTLEDAKFMLEEC